MPDSSSLPKSMLSASAPVAFVPITDKDQALAFYRDQLGLTLLMNQSPFALVFDLNGTMLRATFIPAADFKPQQFTVLRLAYAGHRSRRGASPIGGRRL